MTPNLTTTGDQSQAPVSNAVVAAKEEFAKLLLIMTALSLLAPLIIVGVIIGAALTAQL